MSLEGANAQPSITGADKLPGIVNYFIGNDPQKWRTNIPTYAKVQYKDVYPGIDLAYYGNQGKLEYDLIVAPGADPSQIMLAFDGADKLEVDPASGDLVLTLPQSPPSSALSTQSSALAGTATLRLQKPLVYQLDEKGQKQLVAGNYVLLASSTPNASPLTPNGSTPDASRLTPNVAFKVASYDRNKPLIIDPVLFWSTYLGGSGGEEGRGIAVDAAGNAYVTGYTSSVGFPGTVGSPIQATNAGGADAFVTKINAAGTALVYSTYLGGSGPDMGSGIAVDAAGNAYVTGHTATMGSGFPGTAGSPIQSTHGGVADGFVTKINAAGTALVYSTYLGGSSFDEGRGIAVDAAGNAYVTGHTATIKSGFPGTFGSPIQSTSGGGGDGFVTKINAAGTALVYSTYLGGSDFDIGHGIAVDAAGNAYVTGRTDSVTFPSTAGAFQTAHGSCVGCDPSGFSDGFVTKLNATGSAQVYSTFLGGQRYDEAIGIAVDTGGNAYIAGGTASSNFPTINAIDTGYNLGGDAFITKLNAAGSAVLYSSYLGESANEGGKAIAIDHAGNAYLAGETNSTNFPTANAVQAAYGGGSGYDVFVAKFNTLASGIASRVFSTYLGGSGDDHGTGIAVDAAGNAYVTGTTDTTGSGFPGTAGSPIQNTLGGSLDAFVAKICNDPPNTLAGWNTTGSLTTARHDHSAALLPDGNVFVVGGATGFGTNDATNTTELYDPVLGTWSTKATLGTARAGPTLLLLPNGKVLAAGGRSGDSGPTAYATAELYDPVANSWTSAGTMSAERDTPSGVLLADGRVLMAGGCGNNGTPACTTTSADLYDPSSGLTGTWTSTGNLNNARADHTLTLLPDGRVLAAGGFSVSDGEAGADALSSAELYDPALGTWSLTGSMATGRKQFKAVLLPSGKVLVSGGLDGSNNPVTSAELYDPQSGTWSSAGSMLTARAHHTATLLPNGKVLVAGGATLDGTTIVGSTELYDPVTNTWSSRGNLVEARGGYTATLLADGRVLAAAGGGVGPASLTTAELYISNFCGPEVTSVSDSTVQAGSAITIKGTGFGATQGTSTVTVGGVSASILSWSDNEIVATVPAGAEGTNKPVAVNVNGQASNAPTLTSITPGIASLAISPTSPTIAVGQTQPFTITATMTDGSMQTFTIPVPYGIKILGGAQRAVAIDPATGSVTPTGPVLSTFVGASAGHSALDVQGQRGFVIIGGNIVTVDTANELVLPTNPMQTGVSSLEFDQVGNKLLGVALLDHDNDEPTTPTPTPRRNVLVELTRNPDGTATGAVAMIGTGATGFPEVSAGVSAIDPAGHRYFVSLGGSLVTFDTQNGAVTSVAIAQTPSSMEYDSGENRLFGIALDGGVNKLVEIIPGTGQVSIIGTSSLPGPNNVSAGVATLDPDNDRYYVSFAGQFHSIDTATGNILSSAPFSGASSLLFHPLLTSSNPAVATVSQNPSATGVSPGTSTITATVADANASTLLTVINTADLTVTKADSPDPVAVSGVLTYTVTVTNGPSAATNVVVTDTLPSGVTFNSVTASQGSCTGTTTITCTVGNLANGASAQVTIAVTAPSTPKLLTNTVNASATESDPTPGDNTAIETTVVRSASPQADLLLTVSDTPDPVSPGSPIAYTLTVRNNGGDVATGVTLTTNVPAGTTFSSVMPSQGSCVITSAISCNLGTVDINATATVNLAVTPTAAGFVTLTATADEDNTTTDPNTANNTNIAEQTTVVANTFTVNSTGDAVDNNIGNGTCFTGTTLPSGFAECTLRAAMQEANATTDPDLIAFNILGAGPHTIAVGGTAGPTAATRLPNITRPVVIDGYTQPGATANTMAVGSNSVLKIHLSGALLGAGDDGLVVSAADSTIRGMVINGFTQDGIVVLGARNRIEGNFIGTTTAGDGPLGNQTGIFIIGSADNVVGGAIVASRNVISANTVGIIIAGVGGTGNRVQNNYIGISAQGDITIPNGRGISLNFGANNNTIGGTTAAERNVISGNTITGIGFRGATTTGNVIEGNFIGTNPAGTGPLPNAGHGILVEISANNNVIGPGNVISGNGQNGILISDAGTSANHVRGNFIGTKANGSDPLPNLQDGVSITGGATLNTIGGTATGAGNVISGNSLNGIRILSASNVVQGNFIGTNAAGIDAVPNTFYGIAIEHAPNTIIGGTMAGARNVISGNLGRGISVLFATASGTVIQGNFIGTRADGMAAIPNGEEGIRVDVAAPNQIIGGTDPGAGNVISGNGSVGVILRSNGNTVQGNFIGTNVLGTSPLANNGGLSLDSAASGNIVGGTASAARNIISGNNGMGLLLINGATANTIQGNYIGVAADGDTRLANVENGVLVRNSANNNLIGGDEPGAGNVISGSQGAPSNGNGIWLDSTTFNNTVKGNFIGTNAGGNAPVPNLVGIRILGSNNNIIGGTSAGARNIISGNLIDGIELHGSATGTVIQGNFIGTDVSGTSALPNAERGILLFGSAANNTIGGTAAGAANTIAFNTIQGVLLTGGAFPAGTGNAILTNSIHDNGALGIDLEPTGVTPNDPGDGDTGGNNLQNFPVLTSAVTTGSSTTVTGFLISAATMPFTLELFANTACDPSGFGEGQTFVHSFSVTTNSNGNRTFTATVTPAVPAGQFLTATATDPANNTSEFSQCRLVDQDSDGDGVSDGDELLAGTDAGNSDTDGDGILDGVDNCPITANADQADADGDGIGNACDPDSDNDSILDDGNRSGTVGDALCASGETVDCDDNAPLVWNPEQGDADLDGVADVLDNCPSDPNGPLAGPNNQVDSDGDGLGDVCDLSGGAFIIQLEAPNSDGDAFSNNRDNCPTVVNNDQADADGDGQGDACDICANDPANDQDRDLVCVGTAFLGPAIAGNDNCPTTANPLVASWVDKNGETHTNTQRDFDLDGLGDACDPDADGDGVRVDAIPPDCNDRDATIFPGNDVEPNNDGKDNDCDPTTLDAVAEITIDSFSGTLVQMTDAGTTMTTTTSYAAWLPTVGGEATLTFTVTIQSGSGYTAGPVDLQVIETTKHPGQYTNDPNQSDLGSDLTVLSQGPNTIMVKSHDFGGRMKLQATSTITPTDGSAQIMITKVFTVPLDANDNLIADAFEPAGGVASATEDVETSAGNSIKGDGLTALEEYRGFVWGTALLPVEPDPSDRVYQTKAYVPTGPRGHFRGSLTQNQKDVFVQVSGFSFGSLYTEGNCTVPCPFAFGSAPIDQVGLALHVRSSNVADLTGLPEGTANIDVVQITNAFVPFGFDNGHINKVGLRDWSWDIKGSSGIGSDTVYGGGTTHYQASLQGYVLDKPYRDGGTTEEVLANDRLDPVDDLTVEDGNDDGVLRTSGSPNQREDDNSNGLLDGDRVFLDFVDSPQARSALECDGDGKVELPILSDCGAAVAGTYAFEYHPSQVIKHTITHEFIHSLGGIHNQCSTCLMYEKSPNWSRDGNGAIDADTLMLLRVHND